MFTICPFKLSKLYERNIQGRRTITRDKMRKLYYNPIELPAKVHIISKCFGVDVIYEQPYGENAPIFIADLYKLAQLDAFDEVAVYLTLNNDAYYRENRRPFNKYFALGWISLKESRHGGGYLEDKYFDIV